MTPSDRFNFRDRLHGAVQQLEELIAQKNLAYGNSYEVVPAIIRILYPSGVAPEQFDDMLLIVRVLDKLKRIVERNDPFGEDPWTDIAGYALLRMVTKRNETKTNSRHSTNCECSVCQLVWNGEARASTDAVGRDLS